MKLKSALKSSATTTQQLSMLHSIGLRDWNLQPDLISPNELEVSIRHSEPHGGRQLKDSPMEQWSELWMKPATSSFCRCPDPLSRQFRAPKMLRIKITNLDTACVMMAITPLSISGRWTPKLHRSENPCCGSRPWKPGSEDRFLSFRPFSCPRFPHLSRLSSLCRG